jgi:hypothetical protein
MKLTYDAILNDPSLLDRIEKQAHRERAEAVHHLVHHVIVRPLSARLARAFKASVTSHAARPHLARQG